MKVGFIGAGKVGTSMGIYLTQNSFTISGYFSKTLSSSKHASSITNSRCFEDLNELISNSDIIAISVPDDIIEKIALDIFELLPSWSNKIICHFSGVHSSSLFEEFYQKGATICSVHPMLSFGDINLAVKSLFDTPITFEGKGSQLIELIAQLKTPFPKLLQIETHNKTLYHAAACVVSNYMVTLMDLGLNMLYEAGFEEKIAVELISPLTRKTLDNILLLGPSNALTGPISRGDTGTVEKHIEALSKTSPLWSQIYSDLATLTLDLAMKKKSLSTCAYNSIKSLLNNKE